MQLQAALYVVLKMFTNCFTFWKLWPQKWDLKFGSVSDNHFDNLHCSAVVQGKPAVNYQIVFTQEKLEPPKGTGGIFFLNYLYCEQFWITYFLRCANLFFAPFICFNFLKHWSIAQSATDQKIHICSHFKFESIKFYGGKMGLYKKFPRFCVKFSLVCRFAGVQWG